MEPDIVIIYKTDFTGKLGNKFMKLNNTIKQG